MAETLKHICAAISAVLILLLACAAVGADIVPDPEFDGDGLSITKIGAGRDEARAIAVQDDGRVIVAGMSGDTDNSEMAVIRYLEDGSIDRDFSFTAGSLIGTGFGSDGVRALQINPDGTIILGGYATEQGVTYGTLVRLLADGRLDYSFGEQGVVLFTDNASDFYDIDLGADQQIIAVGSSGSGADRAPLIARFAPDGSLDQSFGDNGTQVYPDLQGELHGISAIEGEALVAGGYVLDDQQKKELLILRLKENGTVDETFADQGLLRVTGIESEIVVNDVGVLLDGRIAAVGEAISDEAISSIMVSRFFADGSPDTSLSETGILDYDIGEESGAYGVSVLDSGTILATGYRRDGDDKNTVILRLEPSGNELREIHLPKTGDTIDEPGEEITQILKISALQVEEGSFNLEMQESSTDLQTEADLITTVLDGSDEESQAIAALDDGTIYTAGSSGSDDDSAILVASYTTGSQSHSVESVLSEPSDFYTIVTLDITDITRVGALTGGRINALEFDGEVCAEECAEICESDSEDDIDAGETDEEDSGSDEIDDSGDSGFEEGTSSEEELTCIEECRAGCIVPTVDRRGVVYSVDPFPEYDSEGDSETPDDGDTGDVSGDVTDGDVDDGMSNNPLGRDSLLNFDDYFVTGGQTDDGEGVGEYSSNIEEVNPQTVYYVRAYALLSDGTVLYGNQEQFRTQDSCFIATAAFGSIDGQGVRVLRQFRDRFLATTTLGKGIIGWYYHVSPPIADFIRESLLLRALVIVLLLPVVLWSWVLLNLHTIMLALVTLAVLKYWNNGMLRRTSG